MAYRQPRPPQPQGDDVTGYMAALHRFLREFCTAAWDADRRRDAQTARMQAQIDRLAARLEAMDGEGEEG